jgi:two-component system cell cycle sensor histidine kinase/response regulator CckA
MEQAHEAVAIPDVEGGLLYVNPAFENASGYGRDELLGKNPRLIKSGLHDEAFYRDLWETILSGNPWQGRMTNRRKDGSLFTEDSVISPVRDDSGKVAAFVATKRDVTREVALQADLEQAKKFETIGMITNGVAHEVRNPLFAITAVVGALEKKLGDQPQFNEYVSHIQEQVRRLADLMDDLLTLGRPVNPKEMAPCDLGAVLSEAAKNVEAATERIRGAVEVSAPPGSLTVMGIATKLVQVFVNLIQNAAHFTPEGSGVEVRLTAAGGWAEVTVADVGPGIPEDLLPAIFEPFRSRRKGGTGLGLAIVRQVVKAHGGTVAGANRTDGPGAIFTVRLPLKET